MSEDLSPKKLVTRRVYLLKLLIVLYAIAIAIMCFSPQPQLFEAVRTPNVIYYGRLRLLLVPFNTLIGFSQLDSHFEQLWVICQNILNILLLFPLVFLLHFVTDKWRSPMKSLKLGFFVSLFIETSQLILDIIIDANRVFEIDDLWTNTLGALLAYFTYKRIINMAYNRS